MGVAARPVTSPPLERRKDKATDAAKPPTIQHAAPPPVVAHPPDHVQKDADAIESPAAIEPAIWVRIIRSQVASPMVRTILTNSTLVELKPSEVTISCAPRYAVSARSNLAQIAAVFEKELGRRLHVVIRETEASMVAGGAVVEGKHGTTDDASVEDPLVKLAAELFGARIVAVQARTIQPD